MNPDALLPPLQLSGEILLIALPLFFVLGVSFAALLAQRDLRFKWFWEGVATFPLIFPPIATGYLLLVVLGRNSFIGSALDETGFPVVFHFTGLVIAAVVAGLPLIIKPVQSALEQFPLSVVDAAKVHGKGSFVIFRSVVSAGQSWRGWCWPAHGRWGRLGSL